MSALDDVLKLAKHDKMQNGYTFFNQRGIINDATSELATLRASLATAQATVTQQAAQIEAMELERGELILARDYARDEAHDALEAQAAALEQAREMLDLIVKNSKEVSEGDCVYCNCEQGGGNEFDCYYDCPMNDIRKWLAAHPAPARDEATAAPISAAEQDMIDSWHDRL